MFSSLRLLLNPACMTLNLWDMFLEGRGVEINVGGGKVVLKGGKFAIHKHYGGVKPTEKLYYWTCWISVPVFSILRVWICSPVIHLR